jgi:hypothetical protein
MTMRLSYAILGVCLASLALLLGQPVQAAIDLPQTQENTRVVFEDLRHAGPDPIRAGDSIVIEATIRNVSGEALEDVSPNLVCSRKGFRISSQDPVTIPPDEAILYRATVMLKEAGIYEFSIALLKGSTSILGISHDSLQVRVETTPIGPWPFLLGGVGVAGLSLAAVRWRSLLDRWLSQQLPQRGRILFLVATVGVLFLLFFPYFHLYYLIERIRLLDQIAVAGYLPLRVLVPPALAVYVGLRTRKPFWAFGAAFFPWGSLVAYRAVREFYNPGIPYMAYLGLLVGLSGVIGALAWRKWSLALYGWLLIVILYFGALQGEIAAYLERWF